MVDHRTARDEERFAELRERLEDVDRQETATERIEAMPGPIDPMLASAFEGDLADLDPEDWFAEEKYDGTRLLLEKFDGAVSLFTRRHVERSGTLPRLTARANASLPDGVILDGEYVFLDPAGGSRFVPIHTAGETVDRENLTPRFLVFDLLAVDSVWSTREPIEDRKARLGDLVPDEGMLRTVEPVQDDIRGFYEELTERGEEGIVVKRHGSAYHTGTRSGHWRKVKAFRERDLLAVGYTRGEGARADTFGALVLSDGDRFVGRVGSGFAHDTLAALREEMQEREERPVPFSDVGSEYTPVEPFVVQVKYQEITPSGDLRAPVFLRRRPEKPVADVAPLE